MNVDPRGPADQRGSHSANSQANRRRPLVVVGAVVGLLIVIALLSQLVRPPASEDTEAPDEAEPLPVAVPTATPPETPTVVPATRDDSDGPAAFNPGDGFFGTPRTGWSLVRSQLMTVTPSGVYLSDEGVSEAALFQGTAGLINPTCSTHDQDFVWLVGLAREGGALSLWSFDIANPLWSKVPTPNTTAALGNCSVARSIGGLVVVTASSTEIDILHLRTDGGTSWQRRFSFPESWTAGAPVNFTEVSELFVDANQLIVDLCVGFQGDSFCSNNLLRFDLDMLQLGRPWEQAFTGVVQPSSDYAGERVTGFSGTGLNGNDFEVVDLDCRDGSQACEDQIWFIERHEPGNSGDEVTWAAAALGKEAEPLPAGLRPQLFRYEEGVVATLFRAPDSGTVPRPSHPFRWWIFDSAVDGWSEFEATLAVPLELRALYPSEQFSGLLEGPDGTLSAVLASTPQWDDVDLTRERSVIVGDRAYVGDGNGHVAASEFGAATERFQPIRDGCRAVAGEEFAALIHTETVSYLLVDSPEERRLVPVRSDDGVSQDLWSERIKLCRPVGIDGVWHTATFDVLTASLRVVSVHPDDRVVNHEINLAGEWLDALTGISSNRAWIDLYRDGDSVVVHVCIVNDRSACEFADFSFDHSLVSGEQTITSALVESERGSEWFSPLNNHEFGGAEILHQLGTELWRADSDEPVGVCLCGEDAGDGPYYSWVGGPFKGEAERPAGRTVSYRLVEDEVLVCTSDAIPDTAHERDEPGFIEPDPETYCRDVDDPSVAPVTLTSLERPWTAVSTPGFDFSRRDQSGEVFVVPTAGR